MATPIPIQLEFTPLDEANWVGFAMRTTSLHWRRNAGLILASLGAFPLAPGGLGLLSVLDDIAKKRPITDLNLEIVMLTMGISLLAMGVLLIKLDSMQQKHEVERGELNATGILWNPKTQQKMEGQFRFSIDIGEMMFDKPKINNQKPMRMIGVTILFGVCGTAFIIAGIWSYSNGGVTGIILGLFFAAFPIGMKMLQKREFDRNPIGFSHRCHSIQHVPNHISTTPKPVLKLSFTVKGGMTKGEFAGSTFTSRKNADLDTVVLVGGSITRLWGAKANPFWLCSEIGTQFQQKVPDMIDVQLAVGWDVKNAVTNQSSNAGVIGAGIGGAVGGLIGASIEVKKGKQRLQEFNDHLARNTKLYNELQSAADKFGWRVNFE
jgi:hypothetical protein